MSTPRPLTLERIRRVLDAKNVSHKIDSDGDIVVPLSADSDVPYGVIVVFGKNTIEKGILLVTAFPDKKVPDSRKAEAVMLCNKRNSEKLWPKAYYRESSNTMMCEYIHDCTKEVHDEMLTEAVTDAIGLSWNFYKEAAKAGL